ncbi:MAG TPA: histidine kinase, partial [Bacteroidia bacterium]|nr:histidine kinase [Bacteroidia bacterium]
MSEAPREVLIVVVYVTIVLLVAVVVLISFFFIYQRRQYTNQQEKQRIHDQYEREILKTQLEVQEQTHQQISRDIHDNVGQVLAVVRMYLRGLEESCDEKVKKRIHETDQLVGGAISDLRNLAHSLSSEQLKNTGLTAVLTSEVERISNSGQIEISVSSTTDDVDTDHEIKLILFRICQELLANLIKHSKATSADVKLKETEAGIHIAVSDNGIGFIPGTNDGNGLFNIYRRAELIGARVSLRSEP